MAKGSRPRKSSQRKTSSRAATKRHGRPARAVDPLELYVTLVAGADNLSITAARGLLHLRQAVISAQRAAKGALIKLELDEDGDIDWYNSAAKAPLLRDIFSLLCLQLIDDFPLHAPAVRRVLSRIRRGFDVCKFAFEMREQMIRAAGSNRPSPDRWKDAANKIRIDESIIALLSPVAVWAIREMTAASLRLHRKRRLVRGKRCSTCKGMPYARQGSRFLCGACETRWPASGTLDCLCDPPEKWKRVEERCADGFDVLRCAKDKCTAYNLDSSLDAAFEPFWYVKLVKLMDAPYAKSALQSPRG